MSSTNTITPHRMVRAVPGDKRCAECGLTAGTKAHREWRELHAGDQVDTVPSTAGKALCVTKGFSAHSRRPAECRFCSRSESDHVPAGDQVDTVPAVQAPVSAPVPATVPAESEGSAMQLTMSRQSLIKAMALAMVAVPKRPAVPILSGVLLTATFGGLTVRATDWDTFASADVEADVTREGSAVVAARVLADWVGKLPAKGADLVTITLTDPCTLRVHAGNGHRELPTMPVEDFPEHVAPTGLGRVPLADLVAGIGTVAPAAGTDDHETAVTGINMGADWRRIHMFATDRYRLATVDVAWSPADRANDWGALPPAKVIGSAVKAFRKIAGNKLPGDVVIGAQRVTSDRAYLGMQYAAADGEYYTLTARCLDEKITAETAGQLFPSSVVTAATFDGAQLVDLVGRVTAGTGRGKSGAEIPVILTFAGDQVTAEYHPETGTGEQAPACESLPGVTVTGPEVTIGFNPAYLVDAVKTMGAGQITVALIDGFKPAVFRPADDKTMRHLLMPIRVTRTAPASVPASVPASSPAPGDEPHPFAKSLTNPRRCAVTGCDRGQTSKLHTVKRAAATPESTPEPADQGDAVPAVDQVETPAPVPATVPASEPADQVTESVTAGTPANVREIIAAGAWSLVNVGTKRAPHFCPLMKLPAGRLDRDTYMQVRDTLARVARGSWSKSFRGFTFPAGIGDNGFNGGGSPSGTEMVAAWLAETAPAIVPAVDQVETPAPVPASEPADRAPLPIEPADFRPYADQMRGCRDQLCRALADAVTVGADVQVPARALLAALVAGNHVHTVDQVETAPAESAPVGPVDGRALALVDGVVPEYPPAPILPAGVLATVTLNPGPADFKPYRDEIDLCECTVCVELAYNNHHWSDKRKHREAARVLLAHLVAGTHQRMTLRERSEYAKRHHASLVDAAKAAGLTGDELFKVEHPDVWMRMQARRAARDDFTYGIGLGIGDAPIHAEAETLARAAVAAMSPETLATVRDLIAAGTWSTEEITANGRGVNRNATHRFTGAVLRLADGAAPKGSNAYNAVRDVLRTVANGWWNHSARGWTFDAGNTGKSDGWMDVLAWSASIASAPVDQVETVAESVPAGTVDQVPAVAAVAPVRLVYADTAPVTVPAVDQVETESVPAGTVDQVPAIADGLHGAHAQRVHVSGREGDSGWEGDGYRFHLVAGSATRALGKAVRSALGTSRAALGGVSFSVTSPAKSLTVNVVPQPGHMVSDWSPVLALVASVLAGQVDAGECSACDRSAVMVES